MPTRPEDMRVTELLKVAHEAADTYTLWFRDALACEASPGQYLMVWNPGVDEVPMSVSTIDRVGSSSVTVRVVGEATKALCELGKGDRIGLRGPFGNGYKLEGSGVLLVGGGSGVASLSPLAEQLSRNGVRVTFVNGARSVDHLLFEERLGELLGESLLIATDDGSKGFKGYAPVYAAKLMDEREFDHIYTCGPELMMAAVYEEAERHGTPVQASLERYVKCAVGLCGACAIGPYRVCKDGPVFDSNMLSVVREELGKRRMDPSGRAIKVDH